MHPYKSRPPKIFIFKQKEFKKPHKNNKTNQSGFPSMKPQTALTVHLNLTVLY